MTLSLAPDTRLYVGSQELRPVLLIRLSALESKPVAAAGKKFALKHDLDMPSWEMLPNWQAAET